jgi:hypothetical protein
MTRALSGKESALFVCQSQNGGNIVEDKIIELIGQFFADPKVRTVIGLVVADILMGIGGAIRRGDFQWRKLLQFYRTNVVPYVFIYGGVYVGVQLAAPSLLGEYAELMSKVTLDMVFGIIVYNLVMSIAATLESVGITLKTITGRLLGR